MDAEIKKKWVKALRGGYEQGASYLRRGDTFCCLGVLCDLLEPDRWHRDGAGSWVHYRDAAGIINASFAAAELGLDYITQKDLASMNDSGKSFEDIADYIEKNL